MKPCPGAMALLLCAQLALPSAASARSVDPDEGSERPAPIVTIDRAAAAQGTSSRRQSSPGGKLLRSTLIGAAIGAGVVAALSHMLSDCRGCGSTSGKDLFSGALYGGLIGAAIGSRPSRGPSYPSRSRTAVGSTLTPRLKAVSVAVRF